MADEIWAGRLVTLLEQLCWSQRVEDDMLWLVDWNQTQQNHAQGAPGMTGHMTNVQISFGGGQQNWFQNAGLGGKLKQSPIVA